MTFFTNIIFRVIFRRAIFSTHLYIIINNCIIEPFAFFYTFSFIKFCLIITYVIKIIIRTRIDTYFIIFSILIYFIKPVVRKRTKNVTFILLLKKIIIISTFLTWMHSWICTFRTLRIALLAFFLLLILKNCFINNNITIRKALIIVKIHILCTLYTLFFILFTLQASRRAILANLRCQTYALKLIL
jgi:hypothetical protein